MTNSKIGLIEKIIILLLLIIKFSATAQTIKLDYIPKDQIVTIYFKNLTFYTDTISLFSIKDYSSCPLDRKYDQGIKNLVNINTNNDTAIFIGSFIPFNDSLLNPIEPYWRVWLSLRQLTIENKVLIIDSHGKAVKKIKIKRKGSKKDCWTGKVFINMETKEELFVYEDIYFCSGLIWDY